jgi:Holliday junction resolvasome RuvABC endonuclease subunit
MSEIVEVIGVDPSVRFTGIAKVIYNTETQKFKVKDCQVLLSKTTLKGTEKLKDMLIKVEESALQSEYDNARHVIVESPVFPFYAKFQPSSMIRVAHIAGGAASIFGIDRVTFYTPSQWNHCKKKEDTHAIIQKILGPWEEWGWKVVCKRADQVEHVLDAASMALYHIQQIYL